MQPSVPPSTTGARATPAEFPRPFGAYMLLSSFAHGGMGEVYLAKSGGIRGIDRLCVLKKLRPDVNANEEYVRRFLDEARVVVQLSHPHIAHVFDVGKVGRENYLAMEYISGANLKEIHARTLARSTPEKPVRFPPGLALHVIVQTLDALDYAHRQAHPLTGAPLHVVHRDVSPQNVMVSYEGDVKLIDFGLAASEIKTEHTESQIVMGKVAYMAPEQARGEKVDARTDLFSTAIVLYELLTGERFYGAKSNYDIWQVVGHGGYVPERWDRLDVDMTRILSRALAAKPEHRYASCADFRDELERLMKRVYPETNKRALRTLMEQSFTADRELERKFLARFADVSASSARPTVDDGPPSSTSADPGAPLEPHEKTEAGVSAPSPVAEKPADFAASTLPPTEEASVPHESTDPIRPRPSLQGVPTTPAPVPAARAESVDETGALVRATYGEKRSRAAVLLLAVAALALLSVIVVVARGGGETVADAKPVDAKPVDAKPVDAKPADAKPVDANPVDAKPVDTKPVDTKPVDAKPVDSKPVDAKPVDAKPVDAKPSEAKPTSAKPPKGDAPSGSTEKPAAKPDSVVEDESAPVDDAFVKRANAVLAAQQLQRAEVLRMLGRCGHLVCASIWKNEARTTGLANFNSAQDTSMKGCLLKCIEDR